jgi:hypothetical protein
MRKILGAITPQDRTDLAALLSLVGAKSPVTVPRPAGPTRTPLPVARPNTAITSVVEWV